MDLRRPIYPDIPARYERGLRVAKIGNGKADARVAAWVADRDAASSCVSALTVMVLEIGVLRIERRDTGQGERLRTWMDRHVLPEFQERTLPVDSQWPSNARDCMYPIRDSNGTR